MKRLEPTSLADRMTLLEQSNRRLRGTLLFVLLGAGALPLLAWRGTDPTVVRAQRFELAGAEDGKVLGVFELDKDGLPFFEMRDANETPRIRMKIGRGGSEPIISMHDPEGMQRSSYAMDASGNPHWILQDKGQKPRLHAAVSESGAPSLIFIHVDGTRPAGIGVTAEGKPWKLPVETKPEDGK